MVKQVRSFSVRLWIVLMMLLSISTLGLVTQPASAQGIDIDYGNCAFLYAVQGNETLNQIATRFNTSVDELVRLNNLNRVFPGMVICISEAGGIIPPTGGFTLGLNVVNVDPDDQVTVRGTGFPGGETFTVQMIPLGVANPLVYRIGTFTTPQAGNFQQTFNIPQVLQGVGTIRVRFHNPDPDLRASTTFANETGGGVDPADCAQTYTVVRGDRLVDIAGQFNTTTNRLVELNDIFNPNIIYPGQVLCIALTADGTIPPTGGGGQASIAVLDLVPGETVRVLGENFPTATDVEVVMSAAEGDTNQEYPVATFRTLPNRGAFSVVLSIPDELSDEERILIEFERQTQFETVLASTIFLNTEEGADNDETCSQFYTVVRGDNLTEIAEQFDTTISQLVQLNDETIDNRNIILPGMRLCVAP